MLKNSFIKWTLKILSAVVSFTFIFYLLQPIFLPKYYDDSTTRVHGYSYIQSNSVDCVFLGASQMFCSVDSERLTDKYGLSSYDYGSNSQIPTITSYYLEEALKTQSPKLVMFEIAMVFNNDYPSEEALAWNYSQMPVSFEKYKSLKNVLKGGSVKAFEYAFVPLLKYHDRWNSINRTDLGYAINPQKYINTETRGFKKRSHIEKETIAYLNKKDGEKRKIPEENKVAIDYMVNICKKRNIKLVFFKAPNALWTRADSSEVKTYMKSKNYEYLDLNDKLSEIGIDANKDFYDIAHLNYTGAEKTTDYLATIIPTLY